MAEWISVSDKLPERGIDYLCRCIIKDNTDYPFFMVLRYIMIDVNPHFQHECDDGLRVTHWMPIPELPRTPKERGREKALKERENDGGMGQR